MANVPQKGLSPELLAALREAGLAIEPHSYYGGEWHTGMVVHGRGGGDVGPFFSTEEALVGGVAWLVRLVREVQTERDAMWLDLQRTQQALAAAQAELRAEREAQG